MTEKEAIVKHITEMNTDMLSLVLNDNISYMELTKENFLKKLDEIFSDCKSKNVTKFDKVCPGKCAGECVNKGVLGYNFSSSAIGDLALIFEEDNDEITDICDCTVFETNKKTEQSFPIFISVYDDEKKNYIPSFEQIYLKNKISSLYEQYNQFKGQITPIKNIYPLIKECKYTYQELDLDYRHRFKFIRELFDLFYLNSFVLDIVELNDVAKVAMLEFNELDILDERALVKWLIKYEEISSLENYKKMDNWETNHFIVPYKAESVVLDCTNYEAPLQLRETHFKHLIDVMLRYQPTEDHLKMAGEQGINHSLPSLLTWHMKYLDLLPEDVKITSGRF